MWKLQHRGERRITSPRRHCSVVQSDTWVEKFFALSWHLGSSHHQAQHIKMAEKSIKPRGLKEIAASEHKGSFEESPVNPNRLLEYPYASYLRTVLAKRRTPPPLSRRGRANA